MKKEDLSKKVDQRVYSYGDFRRKLQRRRIYHFVSIVVLVALIITMQAFNVGDGSKTEYYIVVSAFIFLKTLFDKLVLKDLICPRCGHAYINFGVRYQRSLFASECDSCGLKLTEM
jgi:hypothetical protein